MSEESTSASRGTRKRFSNRSQEVVKVSPPNKLPKKKHPVTSGGDSGIGGGAKGALKKL
jgi:hypothetical protein